MKSNTNLTLLIIRLTFGGLMLLNHGIPKINRLFGDEPVRFMDFMGIGAETSLALAIFAEAICAILVMVGLFTRYSVIPLIFTMIVAVFVAKQGSPLADRELGLLYMMAFIGLIFSGAGKYSLDEALLKRRFG